MIRKLLFISLTIILSIYYFNPNENMDKGVMLLLLSLLGISLIIFYTRKEKEPLLKGQFLKHSTFAVLGLLIVNFQYYIDYLIGNIPASDTFIFVNPQIVVKTLVLSLIGLLMFFVGYLSYKSNKNKIIKKEKIYSTKFLEIMVVVFFVLFLSTVNMNYILGGYGSEDRGTGVIYIELLFKVFIIALVVQKTRNLVLLGKTNLSLKQYIINQGIWVNLVLGIYLLLVMISGDRGPLMTMSLFVFSGYLFVTKRKIKLWQGLIMIMIAASFITLLGVARSLDSNLSFVEKMQLAFEDESSNEEVSFLPQTKELAGSVKATHHAVDYIPRNHDYLFGRFQFQQLTVAVPFFNVFNELIFDDVSQKYAGSASFVTWIFQGDRPTYGNGTSVIADFYFDFGLFGVIVGLFGFGYFMRMAEIKMYVEKLPGLFPQIFFIVYLGSALYIARSSFLFEFRTLVWVLVVLLVNRHIFNHKTKNKSISINEK